jgi:hypothetical protein
MTDQAPGSSNPLYAARLMSLHPEVVENARSPLGRQRRTSVCQPLRNCPESTDLADKCHDVVGRVAEEVDDIVEPRIRRDKPVKVEMNVEVHLAVHAMIAAELDGAGTTRAVPRLEQRGPRRRCYA